MGKGFMNKYDFTTTTVYMIFHTLGTLLGRAVGSS